VRLLAEAAYMRGGRGRGSNNECLLSPDFDEVIANASSSADLVDFPEGRNILLEPLPSPPNILGRKERDLFCQRSSQ
jgi:hypothetical protein